MINGPDELFSLMVSDIRREFHKRRKEDGEEDLAEDMPSHFLSGQAIQSSIGIVGGMYRRDGQQCLDAFLDGALHSTLRWSASFRAAIVWKMS